MARAKTDKEKNPEKYFTSPVNHIKDRVLIHENEKIPRERMFVSLNGYPFLIKPGEEVDIPRPVRLMLDTRIETITKQDENGKDYTKDVPRITYTLIAKGVNIETPAGDA